MAWEALAAALISLVEFGHLSRHMQASGSTEGHTGTIIIILLGLLIGSVSFQAV